MGGEQRERQIERETTRYIQRERERKGDHSIRIKGGVIQRFSKKVAKMD